MPYKDPEVRKIKEKERAKKWLQTEVGKETRRKLAKAYYWRNRDKILAKLKPKFNQRNKKWSSYRKNRLLSKRYGLTTTQFEEMKSKQDGKCAICYLTPKRLVVDHNHDTGKVRELLCDACNFSLGAMKEDITRFQNSIDYLQKHK